MAHDYLKLPAKNAPLVASETQAFPAEAPTEATAAPLAPAPEVELLHALPEAATTLPAPD
jgi:hypothetical protein